MENAPNQTKICSKCMSELPLSSFARNAKGKHGVTSVCKPCEAEAARGRRAKAASKKPQRPSPKTPEEVSRYLKEWRARNPDKVKKYRDDSVKRYEAEASLAVQYDVPAPQEVRFEAKRFQIRLRQKEWAALNPDKVRASQARYYYKDIDKSRAKCRRVAAKIRKETYPRYYALVQGSKAARKWRKPSWVLWSDLYAIRKEAQRKTLETGVPHEVDHVYPLVSDWVCGLDCPANMRVVPRSENRSKGNKLLWSLRHEHGVTDKAHLYVDS